MRPNMLPHIVAQIAACEGVYPLRDVARAFGVSRRVVQDIWDSPDDIDEVEPPDIWWAKPSPEVILADSQILFSRGLTTTQVAQALGISKKWLCELYNRCGLSLTEVSGTITPLPMQTCSCGKTIKKRGMAKCMACRAQQSSPTTKHPWG